MSYVLMLIYGGFHKWGYPQIIHFKSIVPYKPTSLGYLYLWKPPYLYILVKFLTTHPPLTDEEAFAVGFAALADVSPDGASGRCSGAQESEVGNPPETRGKHIYDI